MWSISDQNFLWTPLSCLSLVLTHWVVIIATHVGMWKCGLSDKCLLTLCSGVQFFLPLPHPPTPTPSPPTLPNTALKMPFCRFIDCSVRSNWSDHINAAQRHLSSSGSNRKPQLQDCQASVHIYTTSQTPESLTELHIYKIPTCSDKFFPPYLFKALLSEKCYWEGYLEICESNNLGGQADKFASSGYKSQIDWICFLSSWEIERC